MKYKVYIGYLNYQKIITDSDVVAEFCSEQRAYKYVERCNEEDECVKDGRTIYWYDEE